MTQTPAPLTITTTYLPGGQQGAAYSASLYASGGTAPYTWSLYSGSLPPGLTLLGATIAGTPSVAGTYNFTLKVAGSARCSWSRIS